MLYVDHEKIVQEAYENGKKEGYKNGVDAAWYDAKQTYGV